jgi:hypothetical protein
MVHVKSRPTTTRHLRGRPPRQPPRALVAQSERPPFLPLRARSDRRRVTDPRPPFHAARGLPAQIGRALLLANPEHLLLASRRDVLASARPSRPRGGALEAAAEGPIEPVRVWPLAPTRGSSMTSGVDLKGFPSQRNRAVVAESAVRLLDSEEAMAQQAAHRVDRTRRRPRAGLRIGRVAGVRLGAWLSAAPRRSGSRERAIRAASRLRNGTN